MIRAIFFDQDNTLVNTKEVASNGYRLAIDLLAKETGVDPDLLWQQWQEKLETVKTSTDPKVRHFRYSLGLLTTNSDLIEKAIKILQDYLRENIKLNLGVKEFFEKKIVGVKYILFTEDFDEQIEIKLGKFGIKDKFDLIVGSSTIGAMKPDIRFLEAGWSKFEIDKKDCLYIGDNYNKDCRLGVENGGKGLVFGKDFTDFRQLVGKISKI